VTVICLLTCPVDVLDDEVDVSVGQDEQATAFGCVVPGLLK
jgi:hypothetical protein